MKRVVVVTGAAGGIGAACAEYFEDRGWLAVRTDRKAGSGNTDIVCDVSIESEVQALFKQIIETHGRLDALVNNAAVQLVKPLEATTLEEWNLVMASNIGASFLCSREAAFYLRESSGAIVNIGSVHSVTTSPGLAAYVTSKGALMAMSRALALELAPKVRVNCVMPGATRTEMLMMGLARSHKPIEDAERELAERHPLRRIGAPAEIASAVEFLADHERSSFITGQTLIVDGGATAQLRTE